jgi:hypothetical protein
MMKMKQYGVLSIAVSKKVTPVQTTTPIFKAQIYTGKIKSKVNQPTLKILSVSKWIIYALIGGQLS